MVICMKDNFRMTKLMEREDFIIMMGLIMKELGMKIYSMDKEKRCGLMVLSMKENFHMARNMERGNLYFLTKQNMWEK